MSYGDPSASGNGGDNGNGKHKRYGSGKDGKGQDPNGKKPGNLTKAFLIAAGLMGGMVLWSNFTNDGSENTQTNRMDWTEFAEAADNGEFSNFIIQQETGAVMGVYKTEEGATIEVPQEPATTGRRGANQQTPQNVAITIAPSEEIAYQELHDDGAVEIKAPPQEGGGFPIFSILMLGIFGAMAFMMFKNMRGGGVGGGVMGVGKSNAKLMVKSEDSKTFDDVAGVEEAKEEVSELVEFLKDPEKFSKMGAKMPKGALLVGPPGTGKTLLAQAVAGEAEVPFYSVSGSDFVQMFVGVGASRVRDMFAEAKKNAPCVIFIDEIDAIAKARGAGINSNDEREQTLNQLLVEMDGFDKNSGIVILAATNRPDVLDPAIKRPGRLDRNVTVGLPDLNGREKILGIHTKNKPLDVDLNLRNIARATPGFSGADLENLANEAAILATREDLKAIEQRHFLDARDKITMGPERKSAVVPEPVRVNTAYHEAGHALMLEHEEHADPLLKVTIAPRGMSGGMAQWMPDENVLRGTIAQMVAEMRVAMGGRIGEELLGGGYQVTGGAVADIDMATKIAKRMVTELGMSEKLGKVRLKGAMQNGYLGQQDGGLATGSSETARIVDEEVKRITDEAFEYAMKVLSDENNIKQLEKLAEALLENETLEGDEVRELIELTKIDDPLKEKYAAPKIQRKPGGPASGPA